MLVQPRDRIVFLGDSITEQQLYTNDVETYLATRFPELGLTFFNAGWGGDTAPGGVARLERDVLALKPTLVTVCYGMNDGRYTLPTADIRAAYVDGLRRLLARLAEAGVRAVVLTPGNVDHDVSSQLAQCDYGSQGLRVLADAALAVAKEAGVPAFDLHALMGDVQRRAKAADPGFTMIPDGVHPDPAGHLVMAYALLKLLQVPPRAARVEVDVASGSASASDAALTPKVRRGKDGIQLELRLDRLPFFVEPAARKVLPFLPFQEEFNRLELRVTSLPAERYLLRLDGARGGALPREAFAAGVDLFAQWMAKPMRRAAEVHRYTLGKDQVYFKAWRILALNGGDTGHYVRTAHHAAVAAVPRLDQGRKALLGREHHLYRAQLVPTDYVGDIVDDGDFIARWWFRGPFPRPFDRDELGGEAAFAAEPRRSGWMAAEVDVGALGDALTAIFGARRDCFAYAFACVESPVEQACELAVGSDDGFALWWNGALLASRLEMTRGCTPDQDVLPVRLRAGRNVLLMKISQYGAGWGFCARFRGLRRPLALVDAPLQ